MEVVVGWFVFSVLAGIIANAKGRSGFGYFLLALLLSPLVGLLAAIAMPRVVAEPSVAANDRDTGRVPCPECAEPIMPSAKKCKHCGASIPQQKNTEVQVIQPLTDEALMEQFGITRVGDVFFYANYSYDKLQDAVSFAQKVQRLEKPAR